MTVHKKKIIELRLQGNSYRQIATLLGCSKSTVSYHCGRRGLNNGYHKYTKEELGGLIVGCTSVREALVRLGRRPDGGHKGLRHKIRDILIEQETYIGQSHNKGKVYISNEKFFRRNSNRRTFAVRNALFIRKIKNKVCESCDCDEWLDKPIPLEVHHRDGDKTNNELGNLQILCPNCHALTDTYKNKKRKAPVAK